MKSVNGIINTTNVDGDVPSSGHLGCAVVHSNKLAVARLLDAGVDPNDTIRYERKKTTPRRVARQLIGDEGAHLS